MPNTPRTDTTLLEDPEMDRFRRLAEDIWSAYLASDSCALCLPDDLTDEEAEAVLAILLD